LNVIKKFSKSKHIPTAGNYNKVNNKLKSCFDKPVETYNVVNEDTQKLIKDLSG